MKKRKEYNLKNYFSRFRPEKELFRFVKHFTDLQTVDDDDDDERKFASLVPEKNLTACPNTWK